ncbi:hypothetical protein [Desulfotomaculum nigrificans]|uniref:hypothetical protein n=1 Tax=Desulfotomaculum nigrificans TaxID=1565 RepID=UPI0001FAE694|nr:hypothetical protein [Desulfotomaculum nigrificans]
MRNKILNLGLSLTLALSMAVPAMADETGGATPTPAAPEQPAVTTAAPASPVLAADYIANITYNLAHYAQKLPNGHLLVCRVGAWDPGVIEVDQAGNEVWAYRGIQANSAQRLDNGNTLVADSGAPGAPFVPRVVEFTPDGKKAWEYVLPSLACAPRYAERLANGNTLVVLPFEVREVSPDYQVVWQYGLGKPGRPGTSGYLAHPVRAHRLANGNTLIVDKGYARGRVLEVSPAKKIVWQAAAAAGSQTPGLVQPLDALRLADGTTLITDKVQHTVFKVDAGGQVLAAMSWGDLYKTAPVTDLWMAQPTAEGNVLIAGTMVTGRTRVAEVVGSSMKVVWSR